MGAFNAVQCVKIAVPPMGRNFTSRCTCFFSIQPGSVGLGVPNLTDKGFSDNVELMYEYEEDGAAMQWFDDQWDSLDYPDEKWLAEYEEACAKSQPSSSTRAQMCPPLAPGHPLSSWNSFVSALVGINEKWTMKSARSWASSPGRTPI